MQIRRFSLDFETEHNQVMFMLIIFMSFLFKETYFSKIFDHPWKSFPYKYRIFYTKLSFWTFLIYTPLM